MDYSFNLLFLVVISIHFVPDKLFKYEMNEFLRGHVIDMNIVKPMLSKMLVSTNLRFLECGKATFQREMLV